MDLHENEILSQIFGIVRRLDAGAEYDNVSGDTTIADLQLDSMNVTQLLIELEAHFDLTLADDELDRVATLSDLAKCILRQRAMAQ
jgi:acyl carrier protein